LVRQDRATINSGSPPSCGANFRSDRWLHRPRWVGWLLRYLDIYIFYVYGCSAADASAAALPSLVPLTNRPFNRRRSFTKRHTILIGKKGKGSPYSIIERRVPELITVLGSQPADDVSHKPGGRLPLLSARPAVTPATLKRVATNFAAW